MTGKDVGLIGKYTVDRQDGAPLDWCFMLEDTDALAIPSMKIYADEIELSGQDERAALLRAKIDTLPRRRSETDESPEWNGHSLLVDYHVERVDGKPVVWCLVLEDTDPFAKSALEGYASIAESFGYQALADDLRAKLPELPRIRERWETDPYAFDHDRFLAHVEPR